MTLSDIPAGSAVRALRTRGIQLQIGPFATRFRSRIPRVQDYLLSHYRAFPVVGEPGVHCNVQVHSPTLIRRWIRKQASFDVNGLRPFLPAPQEMAPGLVEWGLNWYIGRHIHHLLVVHAAVVERDGRAALLPAPPGSGKSTLCAALVYSGKWRLLSDEFALIDPATAEVIPLPRPVALKTGSMNIIRTRYPDARFGPLLTAADGNTARYVAPPDEAVARQGERAAVEWIVMPNWREGAALDLEPSSRARMLAHLTDSSFNYNLTGRDGFDRLAGIVGRALCAKLTYSDLDEALALFDRWAETGTRASIGVAGAR